MSRYIDVDKLKEVFDEHEDDYGYLHGDWEEFIDNAPTADVVEVVRCKDCKHFDKYIDCKEMYQWDGFCDDWARKTYENWYCSRAERRNDGGE